MPHFDVFRQSVCLAPLSISIDGVLKKAFSTGKTIPTGALSLVYAVSGDTSYINT